MKIFKVKLCEKDTFINWNTHYGVARHPLEAMEAALDAEKELSGTEIDIEVLSVEAIAECSFASSALRAAA